MGVQRVALHLDVIKAMMRAQGWGSTIAFARYAGIGRTTMKDIISGSTMVVSQPTAEHIADALEVRLGAICRPIEHVYVMTKAGAQPLQVVGVDS